ncbi:alanine aminotransferase 1-like [Hyalella azteca]|uniref:alanine transaminase n=1 Tax=Hyalella azteca TaxID=294128 RepID=A0A8B7PK85_HYAAZ|nr:alanine aminotransferase 1-like [Hyalella azteca]
MSVTSLNTSRRLLGNSIRNISANVGKGGQYYGVFCSVRCVSTSAVMDNRVLTLDNMNPYVKKMEYAVRGPLVIRATALEKELQAGAQKPFKEVTKANIGDAHAMGQKPITFLRQVVSVCLFPQLFADSNIPEDAKARARLVLDGCKGGSLGSYSDSAGIEIIRHHVADYITRRDGGIKSSWEDIVLCAGASEGIKGLLQVMTNHTDGQRIGVMVPIPQYPLYSATLAEFDLEQVSYYLDESANWALDVEELERSIAEAKTRCSPRALVVINPGNPTGQVLSRPNIEAIIKFAQRHHLFLIADEVYQHNVYADGCAFHSFKKVMSEMGAPYANMELASYMSISKGFMGECGLRGGYAELVNVDPAVKAMFLKMISAKLCPTTLGQAVVECVVNPPVAGDPSYESFEAEKGEVLRSLAQRAKLVAETFNTVPGMSCNVVQGAMYAFPQISMPPKALEAAAAAGQKPDVFYAFQLLENTGICVVPGSGFGQRPGTHHFRTTILPQPDQLATMLQKFRVFHEEFLKKYS